jgi:hypothetical protein
MSDAKLYTDLYAARPTPKAACPEMLMMRRRMNKSPTLSCGDDVLVPPQTASQFGQGFRKRHTPGSALVVEHLRAQEPFGA